VHRLKIIVLLIASSAYVPMMLSNPRPKIDVMIAPTSITFKSITESDLKKLYEWLHTPHVKKWWYPDVLPWDQFVAKYRKKLNSDREWGYIIHANQMPIGYIQYYDAHKLPDNFGNVDPEGTYGMDLYIADPAYIGKGYGTQTLRDFIAFIKQKQDVKKIIIDPHVENIAAIKTYEKVGFKQVCQEEQPNYGRVIIMELMCD
jgi:RimJ/RimL family protein N-acetyltransferase